MAVQDPITLESDIESATDFSLSVEDLLEAESQVLQRVARDFANPSHQMAGHNSTTTGHNSGGNHASHNSAMAEQPLEAPAAHPTRSGSS